MRYLNVSAITFGFILTANLAFGALDAEMYVEIPSGGYATTSTSFNGVNTSATAASNRFNGLAFAENGTKVHQFVALKVPGQILAAKMVPTSNSSTPLTLTDSTYISVDDATVACAIVGVGMRNITVKALTSGAAAGSPYLAFCDAASPTCTPLANIPFNGLTWGSSVTRMVSSNASSVRLQAFANTYPGSPGTVGKSEVETVACI